MSMHAAEAKSTSRRKRYWKALAGAPRPYACAWPIESTTEPASCTLPSSFR